MMTGLPVVAMKALSWGWSEGAALFSRDQMMEEQWFVPAEERDGALPNALEYALWNIG
jgi:hypothetical protein